MVQGNGTSALYNWNINNTGEGSFCTNYYSSVYNYSSWDYKLIYISTRMAGNVFRVVGIPLFLTGVLGNALSILVVLSCPSYRRKSFGFLIIVLAAADTGVLCTGLLRQTILAISDSNLDIRILSGAACKVHTFLSELFTQVSSWTLVVMTMERAISVTLPMTSRVLCNRKRVVSVWLSVCVVTFAVRAQSLWTVSLRRHCEPGPQGILHAVTICLYTDDYVWYWRFVWPVIHVLLVCLLPSVVILCANIQIIIRLQRARKQRLLLARVQNSSTSTAAQSSSSSTPMLISVSFLYLLGSIPMTAFLISYHQIMPNSGQVIYRQREIHTAVSVLAYANNTLNFAMYCLSGTKFRTLLAQLLGCRSKTPVGRSSRRRSLGVSTSTMIGHHSRRESTAV